MEKQEFSSDDTRVVLLNGHAGAGKDTVADYMCARHGFIKLSFAQPIYDMLANMLNVSVAELHDMKREGDRVPGTAVTVRHALQTLGTEWGREMIDSRLWCNLAVRRIQILAPLRWQNELPLRFVISDCRFPNEHNTFKMSSLATRMIGISRKDVEGVIMTHVSEAYIANLWLASDLQICNDGDKFELFHAVDEAMATLSNAGWLTK